MEQFERIIKRGLTDSNRKLIINELSFSFENKDFTGNTFTTFEHTEITDYRFGIKWLSFYLVYGMKCILQVRDKSGKTITVSFKWYRGQDRTKVFTLYNDIREALENFHFNATITEYLKNYDEGIQFTIGNVSFIEEGIIINRSLSKLQLIQWDDIRTRSYQSYFCIFSSKDPASINYSFNYLSDWNTGVLFSVLRTILQHRGIETY